MHHQKETKKWDIGVKDIYKKYFKEFDRIVKENGSIIIFVRSEYISYAVDEAKKNNFDSKATIIWHKTNPIPQVRKKNYLSSIETIWWCARYNEKKCDYTLNFQTQNEMHNFFEYPLCGGLERFEHPTQKPLELIKKLLIIHSNENDIVLDPFLGSGTTAVACQSLKRNFIGIEISPEYCEIARQRLRQKPLL